MSAYDQAHAPYNFVPFHTRDSAAGGQKTELVCVRYESVDQLPGHDVIDPALKTGEIHVTMTAETPVFVSAGDRNGSFFRGANGRLMIPGSTVRGMLRQNMQILGFGTVRPNEDIEDQRIFFRSITARRGSTNRELSDYYQSVLGMQAGSPTPKNVSAGYLCREGNRYRIYPTCAPVLRIRRDDPALCRAHLNLGYARMENVSYTLQGSKLQSISRATIGNGVLLYPGRPIKGHGPVYLFPAADRRAAPLEISAKDILSYQVDLDGRSNTLHYPLSFWKLPSSGGSKPVFYVQHSGHTYFGMTSCPRIGYANSLAQGLPGRDSRLAGADVPLDYPHAVFGFTGRERSYRSRVSVGDFPAEDGVLEGKAARLILAQPKPSWYPGYVTNGDHYNKKGFALRGFKLYWQKDANLPPLPARTDRAEGEKADTMPVMRPLPAGTVFHGVIRYKNLHPDELGLLLWTLRLEDGCRQSLGMAKPFGYGRMRLEIEKLLEYDVRKLYGADGLCASPVRAPADAAARDSAIDGYIRQFDAFICEKLHIEKPTAQKPSITSQENIRDFFFLRRPIQADEDTSYVPLAEYKNLRRPLPTVREIRKRQEAGAAQGRQPAR